MVRGFRWDTSVDGHVLFAPGRKHIFEMLGEWLALFVMELNAYLPVGITLEPGFSAQLFK